MLKRNAMEIQNQGGMVSIIVTMIIMIVLSLIVLGFAQIARREQRQALDRQLSNQAFYAAESGINDARKALAMTGGYPGYTGDTNDTGTGNKTHCGPDTDASSPLTSNNVDSANGVEYTCLLIDQSPKTLEYTIEAGKSVYANMSFMNDGGNPTNANLIKISWEGNKETLSAVDTSAGSWNTNPLPTYNNWKDGSNVKLNSLLRVTLTDLQTGYSRDALNTNSYTAFFYPSTKGIISGASFPAAVYDTSTQGSIINGICVDSSSGGKKCATVIQVVPSTANMFLRLNPIYTSTKVEIVALNGTVEHINDATPLNIKGAQVVIDSTGKANDVLRRVQVHVPVKPFGGQQYAVWAVHGICKQLLVAPGVGNTAVVPGSGSECNP